MQRSRCGKSCCGGGAFGTWCIADSARRSKSLPASFPTRITVFYGHIASNIGDLAINTGTIELIRRCIPGARIEFVLLNAEKSQFLETGRASFGDDAGVTLHHLYAHSSKAKAFLDQPERLFEDCGIAPPECVVLAAGEHLFDYGDGENHKSLFWRLLPLHAAARLGIPCVQLPATFGPFAGEAGGWLVEAALALPCAVAARDLRSRALLADLVRARDIPALLDPAFYMAPVVGRKPRREHGVSGFAMRSDGWGIRLAAAEKTRMTDAFRKDGFASSKSFQVSRRLLEDCLRAPREKVRIFVQTFADHELAEKLAAASPDARRVEIRKPASVQDYIAELAAVDRVYTSRFHAVILALLSGTPAYAVYFEAHGQKMPGLFELIGWPEACANATAMSPEAIAGRFAHEIRDENDRMVALRERLTELREDGVRWLEASLTAPGPALAAPRALRRMAETLGFLANELVLAPNRPAMPKREAEHLEKAYADARVILEYGAGGATVMAAQMPGKFIMSVENDRSLVRVLRRRLAGLAPPSPAAVLHVDVEPAGSGGRPSDGRSWRDFHRYPNAIWDQPFFRDPDVILIDGRFRTACLATAMLRIRKPARVLFDDYADHPRYHEFEHLVKPSRMIGRMAEFELEPEMVQQADLGFLIRQYFVTTLHGEGEAAYHADKG